MSRIDRALEAWEGRGRAGQAPERFSIADYAPEAPSAAAPGQLLQPAVRPSPVADASAAVPVPPLAGKVATREPDIEARLVTGGSGAVPLEQYRRLAAVLHDIQLQQKLKTLMLTSALPAEGKTLTTVNLALTLSESYERRVLIIDADLRFPSVHRVFGIPNDAGLSEALQGQRLDLPIQQVSPRLSVLTAGRPGRTPLAGLTSARMATLIDECAAAFDWVLLDTPPIGLLPDAQLLARLTRAVVFVIAAGQTPAATVERAVAELGPDCIIGTVLNRVDARRIPQSDYYTKYGSRLAPD